MLASSGESGPPCGVPSSLAATTPSTMAPRRRYLPIQPQHPFVPDHLCAIRSIRMSWFTWSKETTTHYPPSGLPGASDRHPPASSVRRTVSGGPPSRAHARPLAVRPHSAGRKQVVSPRRMDGLSSHHRPSAAPPTGRLGGGLTPPPQPGGCVPAPRRRCVGTIGSRPGESCHN